MKKKNRRLENVKYEFKHNKLAIFAVYIDEAGDLGIGRGTRWFVLTAVVVKKTVEPQIRARMTAIKACLNVREIHLRKITEFYKRAFIVRELRIQNMP